MPKAPFSSSLCQGLYGIWPAPRPPQVGSGGVLTLPWPQVDTFILWPSLEDHHTPALYTFPAPSSGWGGGRNGGMEPTPHPWLLTWDRDLAWSLAVLHGRLNKVCQAPTCVALAVCPGPVWAASLESITSVPSGRQCRGWGRGPPPHRQAWGGRTEADRVETGPGRMRSRLARGLGGRVRGVVWSWAKLRSLWVAAPLPPSGLGASGAEWD